MVKRFNQWLTLTRVLRNTVMISEKRYKNHVKEAGWSTDYLSGITFVLHLSKSNAFFINNVIYNISGPDNFVQ